MQQASLEPILDKIEIPKDIEATKEQLEATNGKLTILYSYYVKGKAKQKREERIKNKNKEIFVGWIYSER